MICLQGFSALAPRGPDRATEQLSSLLNPRTQHSAFPNLPRAGDGASEELHCAGERRGSPQLPPQGSAVTNTELVLQLVESGADVCFYPPHQYLGAPILHTLIARGDVESVTACLVASRHPIKFNLEVQTGASGKRNALHVLCELPSPYRAAAMLRAIVDRVRVTTTTTAASLPTRSASSPPASQNRKEGEGEGGLGCGGRMAGNPRARDASASRRCSRGGPAEEVEQRTLATSGIGWGTARRSTGGAFVSSSSSAVIPKDEIDWSAKDALLQLDFISLAAYHHLLSVFWPIVKELPYFQQQLMRSPGDMSLHGPQIPILTEVFPLDWALMSFEERKCFRLTHGLLNPTTALARLSSVAHQHNPLRDPLRPRVPNLHWIHHYVHHPDSPAQVLYHKPGMNRPTLHEFIFHGQLEAVQICLETPLPIDFTVCVGRGGKNPLHLVSRVTPPERAAAMLEAILDRLESPMWRSMDDVDWSRVDGEGRGFLSLAAEHGVLSLFWPIVKDRVPYFSARVAQHGTPAFEPFAINAALREEDWKAMALLRDESPPHHSDIRTRKEADELRLSQSEADFTTNTTGGMDDDGNNGGEEEDDDVEGGEQRYFTFSKDLVGIRNPTKYLERQRRAVAPASLHPLQELESEWNARPFITDGFEKYCAKDPQVQQAPPPPPAAALPPSPAAELCAVVKRCVLMGADVNAPSFWNRPILHHLIRWGMVRAVAHCVFFSHRGIDFTVTSDGGSTPLHWVCRVEDPQKAVAMLRLLVFRLTSGRGARDRVDWGQRDLLGHDFISCAAAAGYLSLFWPILRLQVPYFTDPTLRRTPEETKILLTCAPSAEDWAALEQGGRQLPPSEEEMSLREERLSVLRVIHQKERRKQIKAKLACAKKLREEALERERALGADTLLAQTSWVETVLHPHEGPSGVVREEEAGTDDHPEQDYVEELDDLYLCDVDGEEACHGTSSFRDGNAKPWEREGGIFDVVRLEMMKRDEDAAALQKMEEEAHPSVLPPAPPSPPPTISGLTEHLVREALRAAAIHGDLEETEEPSLEEMSKFYTLVKEDARRYFSLALLRNESRPRPHHEGAEDGLEDRKAVRKTHASNRIPCPCGPLLNWGTVTLSRLCTTSYGINNNPHRFPRCEESNVAPRRAAYVYDANYPLQQDMVLHCVQGRDLHGTGVGPADVMYQNSMMSAPLLHQLIQRGAVEAVLSCLSTLHPLDFTRTDARGNTPLHLLCRLGLHQAAGMLIGVVKRLAQHPEDTIDWGQRNDAGEDFLTVAVQQNLLSVVWPLLRAEKVAYFCLPREPMLLQVCPAEWDWGQLSLHDRERFVLPHASRPITAHHPSPHPPLKKNPYPNHRARADEMWFPHNRPYDNETTEAEEDDAYRACHEGAVTRATRLHFQAQQHRDAVPAQGKDGLEDEDAGAGLTGSSSCCSVIASAAPHLCEGPLQFPTVPTAKTAALGQFLSVYLEWNAEGPRKSWCPSAAPPSLGTVRPPLLDSPSFLEQLHHLVTVEGGDVMYMTAQMRRPILHELVYRGAVEAVRVCLETPHGIDFTRQGWFGKTVLHYICQDRQHLRAPMQKDVSREPKGMASPPESREAPPPHEEVTLQLLQLILRRLSRTSLRDRVDWGQKDDHGHDFLSCAAQHRLLSRVWPMVKCEPYYASRQGPMEITSEVSLQDWEGFDRDAAGLQAEKERFNFLLTKGIALLSVPEKVFSSKRVGK